MRRLMIIIALLVLVPIVEITVLIAVGQVIGLGWTLLLMLATSALGAWLLRHEGGRAWRTFQSDVAEGRPPGPAATNGVLILAGGVFMLVPGFVSDVIGLLCILPPTRAVARAWIARVFADRISPSAATTLFGPRRVRARAGGPRFHPDDTYRNRTSPPGTSASGTGPPGTSPPGSGGEAIEGEIVEP